MPAFEDSIIFNRYSLLSDLEGNYSSDTLSGSDSVTPSPTNSLFNIPRKTFARYSPKDLVLPLVPDSETPSSSDDFSRKEKRVLSSDDITESYLATIGALHCFDAATGEELNHKNLSLSDESFDSDSDADVDIDEDEDEDERPPEQGRKAPPSTPSTSNFPDMVPVSMFTKLGTSELNLEPAYPDSDLEDADEEQIPRSCSWMPIRTQRSFSLKMVTSTENAGEDNSDSESLEESFVSFFSMEDDESGDENPFFVPPTDQLPRTYTTNPGLTHTNRRPTPLLLPTQITPEVRPNVAIEGSSASSTSRITPCIGLEYLEPRLEALTPSPPITPPHCFNHQPVEDSDQQSDNEPMENRQLRERFYTPFESPIPKSRKFMTHLQSTPSLRSPAVPPTPSPRRVHFAPEPKVFSAMSASAYDRTSPVKLPPSPLLGRKFPGSYSSSGALKPESPSRLSLRQKKIQQRIQQRFDDEYDPDVDNIIDQIERETVTKYETKKEGRELNVEGVNGVSGGMLVVLLGLAFVFMTL